MLPQFFLHDVHYGGNATCMMHLATLHTACTVHDILVQFTTVYGICGSSTCFLHEAYYRGNAICMLLVMTKPVTCMMHVVTTHVAYTVYTLFFFFRLHGTCCSGAFNFTCMGHSSAQLFLQFKVCRLINGLNVIELATK